MNGRVYDYNLGRFLSVDPFIQDPGNSQSMNPYSYIMNNPLSGTDPSGYRSICKASSCETIQVNQDAVRDNALFGKMDKALDNGASKGQSAGKSLTISIGSDISSIGSAGAVAKGANGGADIAIARQYASLDESDILRDLFGNEPETKATEIAVNKAEKVIRKATSETIKAGKKAAVEGAKSVVSGAKQAVSQENLDGIALASSGVGLGCAATANAPCVAIAGFVSLTSSVLSAAQSSNPQSGVATEIGLAIVTKNSVGTIADIASGIAVHAPKIVRRGIDVFGAASENALKNEMKEAIDDE